MNTAGLHFLAFCVGLVWLAFTAFAHYATGRTALPLVVVYYAIGAGLVLVGGGGLSL